MKMCRKSHKTQCVKISKIRSKQVIFTVLRSKTRILRRLWNILRRRASVCLPLFETLPYSRVLCMSGAFLNTNMIPGQRWKKLTKQHTQNFESEKFANKICAKNAQNREKVAKMPKTAQKRQKPLIKRVTKNKNQHSCDKISTRGAAAAAIFFH